MGITVNVRYFASIRESLGRAEEMVAFETHALTVAGVREALIARGEPYASALAHGKAVRMALNHHMCDESCAVPPEAELAFFPPVTGG